MVYLSQKHISASRRSTFVRFWRHGTCLFFQRHMTCLFFRGTRCISLGAYKVALVKCEGDWWIRSTFFVQATRSCETRLCLFFVQEGIGGFARRGLVDSCLYAKYVRAFNCTGTRCASFLRHAVCLS